MGNLCSFVLKMDMMPQLTQLAERVSCAGEGVGVLFYQVSGPWYPLSCPQTDLQRTLRHHQVSEERAKE